MTLVHDPYQEVAEQVSEYPTVVINQCNRHMSVQQEFFGEYFLRRLKF